MGANPKGAKGERFARLTLEGMGYQILDANVHSIYGEVDLIARLGDTICFVEVKTRKPGSMVDGQASVTFAKQKKIIQTALLYLQEKSLDLQPRFDVFCVITGKNGEPEKYSFLPGAFDGQAHADSGFSL